jgi:allantoin racemase
MRILIANANTTDAITEACVAAARDAAAPGTAIIGATPAFGPRVISTRAENAIASHALLDTLAAHALEAARQMMPCPVVGMTEAACLTACMLGGRFAILTLGDATMYEELVARHGLSARCGAVHGIPATPQDTLRDPARVQAMLVDAIEALSSRADSVVLAGAVLAGMDRILQPRAKLPLLDGISCAVKLAETLVGMKLPRPSAGSYAPPRGRDAIGLSVQLASLLRGE